MSLPWLRLWDRTLDLPKAQKLSGSQFKAWINLLMIANRQNERGKLPPIDDLAFALRIPRDEADEIVSELVRLNFIDRKGKAYYMHDWESWQPEGKSPSERSKQWREERALTERSKSAPRAQELDTDTEQKRIPPNPPRGEARKLAVARPIFELPDSIPRSNWADFEASRKASKHPLTDGARQKIVAKLERFRAQGHDPAALLDIAVERGWRSVFLPDERFGPVPTAPNGQHVPKTPRRTREEQDEIDRASARNCQ